jgi:hypothetical protein
MVGVGSLCEAHTFTLWLFFATKQTRLTAASALQLSKQTNHPLTYSKRSPVETKLMFQTGFDNLSLQATQSTDAERGTCLRVASKLILQEQFSTSQGGFICASYPACDQ